MPIPYHNRNVIECMFGRINEIRGIATQYHKLAQNFLAAAYLAAQYSTGCEPAASRYWLEFAAYT